MVDVNIKDCSNPEITKNIHVGTLKLTYTDYMPKRGSTEDDEETSEDTNASSEADMVKFESYVSRYSYSAAKSARDIDSSTWHRVPPILAELFATQTRPSDAIIWDLFAGGGEITKHLAF
jgi:hypothetical protein